MSAKSVSKGQKGRFSNSMFDVFFTFVFLLPAFGLAIVTALQFSLAMRIALPLLFLVIAIPVVYMFGLRFVLGDNALLRLLGWIVMIVVVSGPPLLLVGHYQSHPGLAEAFIGIAAFLDVGIILWGVSELIGNLVATRIGRFFGILIFGAIIFFPLFWANYRQGNTGDMNMLYGGVIGIFLFVMLITGLRALIRVIFKKNVSTLSTFFDRFVRILLTAAVFFGGAIFPAIYLTIKEGQSTTLGIFFLLCVPVLALMIHLNFLSERHEI